MIYAELGRYSSDVVIKSRMIGFWKRLVTRTKEKLSCKIYQLMLQIPNFELIWTTRIKNIFIETGTLFIWESQNKLK